MSCKNWRISYLSGCIRKTLFAISTASVIWPDFLLHLLRFKSKCTVRVSKVDLFLLILVRDGILRRAYWYRCEASFNFSFLNKVLPSSRSLFSSKILKKRMKKKYDWNIKKHKDTFYENLKKYFYNLQYFWFVICQSPCCRT